MQRTDFLDMTPAEFEATAKAWEEDREWSERSAWLRTRRLAAILIRPHIKKAIPEDKLIPLPGDRPKAAPRKRRAADPALTAARIAKFRESL